MKKALAFLLPAVMMSVTPPRTQCQSKIVFDAEPAIPLQDFGRVRLGYPACGADGTSYFQMMINPSSSRQTHIVSVAPSGKVTFFELTNVPGLRPSSRIAARSFAVDATGLTVLAAGIASPDSSLASSDQFLLTFDFNGNFLGATGLSRDFRVLRFASYRRNKLLALGISVDSQKPELRVFDKTGATLAVIADGDKIMSLNDAKSYLVENPMGGIEDQPVSALMQYALGSLDFAPDGDGVLLFKAGLSPWLLRINDAGDVNKMSLSLPGGTQLHQVVDSQLAFSSGFAVVAFARADDRTSHILKVNKNTGQSEGEFLIEGIAPTSAICRKDGKYYGVRMAKDGASLVMGRSATTP